MVVDTVVFRPPTEDDRQVLEEMITEHFSEGSSYDVELGLDDDAVTMLVAELDGLVVGVMGLTTYERRAAVEDAMYMFDDATPVPKGSLYGYLHTGYVRDGYTGQGIGSELFERMYNDGIDRGVDVFVADSWFHGGADSPAKMFERYNFRVVERRDISGHADDGVCPKCGPDCVCDAALVVRQPKTSATNA